MEQTTQRIDVMEQRKARAIACLEGAQRAQQTGNAELQRELMEDFSMWFVAIQEGVSDEN